MSRPVITLTTDFGHADGYVGIMKGVILDICPEATLVDISHDIQPQAVRQAAYVLSTAAPFFPPDTIHLVVVDPGVGTARRPVAVQGEQATYVAPDNGVLSTVIDQDPPHLIIHLTEPRFRLPQVSVTFHGRDVFAPAAAHLAQGSNPGDMGKPLSASDLITLPSLAPCLQPDGSWQGEVIHVDHFGNLVTNLHLPVSDAPISIQVGGMTITGLGRTFAAVAPGELVAYVGSTGYLEIATREGSAAAQLGVGIGEPINFQGLVPFSSTPTRG